MLIRCRRCHFFLQQQQSIFINPPPDHSYCRYMKCTLPLHLTLSRTLECMKFAFNYIFCFCLSCHWVSPWPFQFCHLYPSCLADSVGPATEGQTDAPHRSQFAGKLIFVNVTVASSSTSGRWECEIATAEEEEGWEGETTTFWRFSTAKPFLVPILFTLVG